MITQACRIVTVWALVAACGGSSPPPAKGPAEAAEAAPVASPAAGPCRQAVDHLFAVTSAQEAPKVRDAAAKAFVHRCDADRWSDAIRQCLLDVKVPEDADRCEKMLTPEQQQALRGELTRELDAAGVPAQRETGKPK